MKILKFASFILTLITFLRVLYDIASIICEKVVPKRPLKEIMADFSMLPICGITYIFLRMAVNKKKIKKNKCKCKN